MQQSPGVQKTLLLWEFWDIRQRGVAAAGAAREVRAKPERKEGPNTLQGAEGGEEAPVRFLPRLSRCGGAKRRGGRRQEERDGVGRAVRLSALIAVDGQREELQQAEGRSRAEDLLSVQHREAWCSAHLQLGECFGGLR